MGLCFYLVLGKDRGLGRGRKTLRFQIHLFSRPPWVSRWHFSKYEFGCGPLNVTWY